MSAPLHAAGPGPPIQSPSRIQTLLGDLGRATLRGVRKCPKCGTYNGTRGLSCKNKQCGQVFKENPDKKKRRHSVEAVKIVTGSTVQVFSVRLRDRGPDYRGLVQLPLVQDMDGNPTTNVDPEIFMSAARCYVDTCSYSVAPCLHIKSALSGTEEAQPLTLKNSVLNSLRVSNEIKQAIWLLATETTGPLVQRVTKNIMVVKCKTQTKHPLGFLHCAFFETCRNRATPEYKFQCSCRAFKTVKGSPANKDDFVGRCVHYYACICAFASDDQLAEEFSYYINTDSAGQPGELTDKQLTSLFTSPLVTETENLICLNNDSDGIEVIIPVTTGDLPDNQDLLESTPAKRPRKDDMLAQASSALLTLQDGVTTTRPSPGKTPSKSVQTPRKQPLVLPLDEQSVSVSFNQWLASVTERINQTMHYQFDGSPDPLVFHAPQTLFDCLQQRISSGQKKKRLPNSTTAFVRREALPLGTFTKYTWHITNVIHIKQIFDTPEMPLEITRNFVENRDGTFDLYEVPRVRVDSTDDTFVTKQTPIRPYDLKTYLKVGNTSASQTEPTPFIIEWIPDILPKSKIGELRIKLQYGHQRNGVMENRNVGTVLIASC